MTTHVEQHTSADQSVSSTLATHTTSGVPSKRTIVLLFTGLMVTMLMASLSQTILSTALPTIVGELGGVDKMTWVVTGYILASTIMMPVYGRISDLLGRKPVIITAILLFIAGSVAGGMSETINMLVVARVIQGIGGGGLMILSQSAIADVVPARERGKYMGVMGAVFAVSSVAGPLIGGWLTEGPGWRWAFWFNIPLGVLAVLATAFFLRLPKVERTGRARIDYLGMALIAAITAIIVLACTLSNSEHSWNYGEVVGILVVLIAAFLVTESKATNPVIPLELFKNRNFTFATIAALFIGIAMFGALGYMPTYIQMVSGVNATQAGLLMVPMMAGVLVASILSGNLVSRTGKYKVYPIVGTAIMAVGLFLLSTLDVSAPMWLLCSYMAVFGIGLGLGQQILMLIVQDAFPVSIVGTATASFNYFKQVGASVGSAVVGSIFASRLTRFMTENLAVAGAHKGAGGADMHSLTPQSVHELPAAIKNPILAAYNDALLPIFLWMIPLLIVAVAILFFVKQKDLSTTVERVLESEDAEVAEEVERHAAEEAEREAERIVDAASEAYETGGSSSVEPDEYSMAEAGAETGIRSESVPRRVGRHSLDYKPEYAESQRF